MKSQSSGTSGNLWHTNSPVSPNIYACYVHGGHEADCFIRIDTSEGEEGIPVCDAAVHALLESLVNSPGIKSFSSQPLKEFTGQILGTVLTS